MAGLFDCIYNDCENRICPYCLKQSRNCENGGCDCYYTLHPYEAFRNDSPYKEITVKISNGYCKFCGSPMKEALNK